MDFQQIELIHSQCSLMDKVTKVAYLRGQYQRLERMISEFGAYIQSRGGHMTIEEKVQARNLLDMINSVQSEGVEASRDFSNEMLKELTKALIL